MAAQGDESHSFRIAPKSRLIIEWRLEQDGARWGFYRVCDSPADAKRSLDLIRFGPKSEDPDDLEQQPMLLEAA